MKSSRNTLVSAALFLVAGFVLSACGGSGSSSQEGDGGVVESEKAQEALSELKGKVLSTGPKGEKATAATEIDLTDQEMEEIKSKNATAAIVMHYGGNDWTTGQINGLKQQFGKMGVEVIATTDANFKPEKQVSDIETVLAKDPDIMVSIPTDPAATADAYKKAAEEGVELVFMDNVPNDFESGRDYTSTVSADNYGNGVVTAHIMASEIGGEGKIGAIFHSADFFVTEQRYEAFTKTIKEEYPDIEIVEEQGIGGPDFAGQAESAASAMMTKHADLKGIWAVWDVPAEGVMAAARTAGRTDVAVTTHDLGEPVAIDMASNGIVKGLGAERPFDQGVTEAKLAGYALLDKEAPPYVAVPSLAVTSENVLEGWNTVYHQEPPEKVREAAQ